MMTELPQTKKCGNCDAQVLVGDVVALEDHLVAAHPSLLERGLLRNGFVRDHQDWTLPGIYPRH